MSGAPPQHELFEWKPKLVELNMQPCPDEFMKDQRFPFIKGHPKLLGTPYKFAQHGQSGAWVSEHLPNIAGIADDLCFIKSMHTDQFNHAPAELFLYTGSPRNGGAGMGSWITWGLGTENQDLPGFVVLISGGTDPTGGKALWSTGYLPSIYQGVQCRTSGEPIHFVNDPTGLPRDVRRRSLDALKKLNELELEQFGDPETLTRIEQYELAYRMQASVPELMDLSREPESTFERYGEDARKPGTYAANCLLARRLAERNVRFIQLYHRGWDQHKDLPRDIALQCRGTDQPTAALHHKAHEAHRKHEAKKRPQESLLYLAHKLRFDPTNSLRVT
jgi:hypothetical protein